MARRWLLWSMTMVFFVGGGAAGSNEQATDRVRLVLNRAMEIQARQDLQGEAGRAERARLIRQLISESFLSAQMARESLGERWDGLKLEQRKEFEELFADLFQDSYTRMVLNFLRKETVEYLGESQEGGRVKVRTKILRTNEHIPVDYLLAKKEKWFMVDVIIDGVSIVRNYQVRFGQVIASQSFDHLLDQMRVQSKAIKEP